jgi:hypothetical protein
MCNPALIAAGAAVGQLGLSIVSATSKNAQTGSNYDQTEKNANISLAQSYNATSLKNNQEADKAATDSFDVARQMAEAKGRVNANAGEAGVGGVSFATVLSDIESKAGRAKGNIDYNYQSGVQQNQMEAENNRSKTKALINSTPQPSSLGMWSEIGSSAIKSGLKIYDAFGDKGSGNQTGDTKHTYGSEFDI